jgi:hypothetical protein
MFERCVRSAREAGVFKPFVALTDRPLEGCDCYDSLGCDKAQGLFKLHLLKAGMSKLPYDYLIWLDADSLFVRNPLNILDTLSRSPLHVPLEFNLSAMREDQRWGEISCFRLRELFERTGLSNQVYLCQSAFWIIHREAIDDVFEQAFTFWNLARKEGVTLDVSGALGFAMQILCADPEAHLVTAHPESWASDDLDHFNGREPDGQPWPWRHPLAQDAVAVRPAIIHLPRTPRNSADLIPAAVPSSRASATAARDA